MQTNCPIPNRVRRFAPLIIDWGTDNYDNRLYKWLRDCER